MALSFPTNPSVGQQSTQNGRTYQWSGYAWEIVASGVSLDASQITSGTLAAARIGSHASSHASGGSDALSLAASQITSGTLTASLFPSTGLSASSLTTGTLAYGRVGSYLRGYAGFADADDWASRVTSNGGSVSSTTMDAVYRFCQAIQAQGVRPLLWRVNLFCGTGLASALVPLYRGPSLSGTQYGNTTDTNGGNNFAAGNYTETGATGGLVGNGTSRYLDTGLKPATVGTSAHLSCHVTNGGTKSNMFMMGCDNAFDSGWTTNSLDYGSSSIARGTVSNGAGVVSDNSMGTAYSVCVSSLRSTGAMQTIYFNGGMAGRPWNAANGVNNPTFQTQPDWSIYVFASNRKGTAVAYGNDTIAAYSIGLHMQAAAVAAYYQALAAFMTDMGRNI